MNRPLGWHPPESRGRAPHSGTRTAPYGILATLPMMVLLASLPEVYDQGRVGSCTAQALAGAVETIAPHAEYEPERPSREALYWRERQMLGETGVDEGAILADGVAVLRQGWEPEQSHSTTWGAEWTAPPRALAEDAPRVVNSEPLDIDVETIAYELACGSAVVVGLSVTQAWDDLRGDTLPDPSGEVIGGHAVMLCGYRINGDVVHFRVRNSWGESWGDGGYAWLPASWIRVPWCGEAHALRAIRRAPDRARAHTPLDGFAAHLSAAMPLAAPVPMRPPAPAKPPRWCGILDGNHGDVANIRNLAKMREDGIDVWIAKADEGLTWDDPAFATFVPRARAAGLLVDAYHFMRGAHSGIVEADEFLRDTRAFRAVAPMVLCCDWEAKDAPADHVRAFVLRILEVTGKHPVIYTGVPYVRGKIGNLADPILGQCPLWYAAYGVDPYKPAIHPTWPGGYAMMQYTNGGAGPSDTVRFPRKTAGIGGCDRSCFAGDKAAYLRWRAEHAVGLGPSERCA